MQNKPGKSHWIRLLEELPLSKIENEVVKRFALDPEGRGFLPIADVLRSHKLFDEAIELLTEGVQAHPGFGVARVVLARDYFSRGLVIESWNLLQESPVPLYDNVLAQKLIFKMALAFGDEQSLRRSLDILKNLQAIDSEIARLYDFLEVKGISEARKNWRTELEAKGIQVADLPGFNPLKQNASSQANTKESENAAVPKPPKSSRFLLEYELGEATKKEFAQYHVVPLDEILMGDAGSSGSIERDPDKKSIELDSTTLAEIYTKQGYYSKALGVYRRLLRMSPHNDLIRMKLSEVARLEKDQKSEDLSTDPLIFDRMEVVEIIDRQMRYYNDLLAKLR